MGSDSNDRFQIITVLVNLRKPVSIEKRVTVQHKHPFTNPCA